MPAEKKNKRKVFNMSYKLPLKQTQANNKWITLALVGVYAFIAIFIALNA